MEWFIPDDCESTPGAPRGRTAWRTPEQRLLGAILCQAAVDANEPRVKHDGSEAARQERAADMQADARGWVAERGEQIGGFDWLCAMLDLNANAVAREILVRWTPAHTNRVLWMLRGGEAGRRVVARRRYSGLVAA